MNSLASLEDLLDVLENQGATQQQLRELARVEFDKFLLADARVVTPPKHSVTHGEFSAPDFATIGELVHS